MADYIPADSFRVSSVSGYSVHHNQYHIYGHDQGPLVSCQGSFRLVNHHRQPNHSGVVKGWYHRSRSPVAVPNYISFDLENQLPVYVKMEAETNDTDPCESVNSEMCVPKEISFDHSSRSSSPTENTTQNENDSQESTHSKHGKVDPKICGVCGDKALGNNFNAITCESCKAFFRRNALKTKEFVCPFSDSCKVDPVTRRFCQKCRLKKCFEIGMKKEWIMTDEEKKVKKQKIELNRLKRASSDVPLQNESPATKVAVCMIDQKISHAGRPLGSTIPNSPPDPTVPHKIAKQPMMPHATINGMNTNATLVEEATIPMCIVQNLNTNNTNIPVNNSNTNHNSSLPLSSSMKTMSSSLSAHSNASSHITNISTPTLQPLSVNSNLVIQGMSSGDSSSLSPVPVSQVEHHHHAQPENFQIHENNGMVEESHNHNQQIYNQRTSNCMQHSPQNIKLCPSSPNSGTDISSPVSIDNQIQIPVTTLSAHLHQHQHQNMPQTNNYHYLNSMPPSVSIQHSDHEHQSMVWGNISQNSPNSVSVSSSQNPNKVYYQQSNVMDGVKTYALPTTLTSAKTDIAISTSGQFQNQLGRASNSETYCPTIQLPLLSSLIRPGTAESPPDDQHIESQLNHNDMEMASSSLSPTNQDSSSLSPRSIHSNNYMQAISNGPHGHHDQSEDIMGGIHFGMNEIGGRSEDLGCSVLVQHQSSSFDDDLVPLPLNTMDSILSVAITAEFNGSGLLGRSSVPRSKDLNKAERSKLSELLSACQALNTPVDAEGPIKGSETSDPSLINVINLTDVAIRRLIKMSKKISGFKNMCQEDQIALLKGSCTEMMILRSVVSYDPDRDSWNIPHSNVSYNIKLGVLKEARGNLYEEHQRFVKSFKPEWRSDENIMIILCAITLFCAERPNVIHKDVVKLEQDSYYYLLKRYLESNLNGCEARSTYLQLIRKIAELHILNSNHLRVFLEVNPREVEPLLIEIFDLKQ